MIDRDSLRSSAVISCGIGHSEGFSSSHKSKSCKESFTVFCFGVIEFLNFYEQSAVLNLKSGVF